MSTGLLIALMTAAGAPSMERIDTVVLDSRPSISLRALDQDTFDAWSEHLRLQQGSDVPLPRGGMSHVRWGHVHLDGQRVLVDVTYRPTAQEAAA